MGLRRGKKYSRTLGRFGGDGDGEGGVGRVVPFVLPKLVGWWWLGSELVPVSMSRFNCTSCSTSKLQSPEYDGSE